MEGKRTEYTNDDYRIQQEKSEGVKRRIDFRIPLTVLGILLLILLMLFFVGTIYSNQLEQEEESLEAVNTASEDTESQILEEQEAQEELLKLLAQERDSGIAEGESRILEQIQASLTEGTTVVETLRTLYKDQLIVASGGKYHFIPILDTLKKNDYSEENLSQLENGELRYLKDGEVISYKGIDVSKFQGNIDWTQVAQDGVTFAFIRAGYRGYGTKGTLVVDSTARENLQGANDAGIKTGVYFYTQAITREEILEEAQLVLELIAPYRIDCPVVIDVEKVSNANGRMNSLDVQTRTELVKLFCDTIAAAGYRPMVYHNLEMGALMLDMEQLEEYDRWFAYYKKELYFPYAYKIWQYSDKGTVQGISTAVDLNIAFEPVWEE